MLPANLGNVKKDYSERMAILKINGWNDGEAGRRALQVTMSHFEGLYEDLLADAKEIHVAMLVGNGFGLSHEEHLTNLTSKFREELLKAGVSEATVSADWQENLCDTDIKS